MNRYEPVFSGFMALFVTFVVLTSTVGVKLFTVWGMILPVTLLSTPDSPLLPAGCFVTTTA